MTHPNQELIDGLREFIAFLEAHPQPEMSNFSMFNAFAQTPEELAEMIKGVGGVKKDGKGDWFTFTKHFGPHVQLDWNCQRDKVCERIVTGKRTVEKPIMKQVGTETVEEEIVEWKCPPSILRTAS